MQERFGLKKYFMFYKLYLLHLWIHSQNSNKLILLKFILEKSLNKIKGEYW